MADTVKFDRIDLKIVATLQNRARITNQALAEAVGLSPSPCLQRVRRLEQAGVLGRYCARIDLDRLCHSETVFATLTMASHEREDFLAVEKVIRSIPEIVECHKVSGAFDYLLCFRCPSIARYHALSDDLLARCDGLIRLSSHVVLDRTKEFEGYPLDRLIPT